MTMDQSKWRGPQRSPEVNLVPMIDVLMTILIFFVVLTLVMGEQTTLQVSIPAPDGAAPATPATVPDPLVVVVTGQGELQVAGRRVTEADAIAAAQQQLATPETIVVVTADAQAPYERILQVMQRLQPLDPARVTLALSPN
jgi:biopolymer transport protein ExbD